MFWWKNLRMSGHISSGQSQLSRAKREEMGSGIVTEFGKEGVWHRYGAQPGQSALGTGVYTLGTAQTLPAQAWSV